MKTSVNIEWISQLEMCAIVDQLTGILCRVRADPRSSSASWKHLEFHLDTFLLALFEVDSSAHLVAFQPSNSLLQLDGFARDKCWINKVKNYASKKKKSKTKLTHATSKNRSGKFTWFWHLIFRRSIDDRLLDNFIGQKVHSARRHIWEEILRKKVLLKGNTMRLMISVTSWESCV